jgi:hypothetical protein
VRQSEQEGVIDHDEQERRVTKRKRMGRDSTGKEGHDEEFEKIQKE